MKNTFYIDKYAIWTGTDDIKCPKVDFVPSLIRRRLTEVEKIGLYLSEQLEPLSDINCIVFASQFGEWQQTIKLIEQMHEENEMSPAGFSHSVHNAMPGLWAIVHQSSCNYTTVAANEMTIDCAFLEALSRGGKVLLVYAEEECPEFYKSSFPKPNTGHGAGVVLSLKPEGEARKVLFETLSHSTKNHLTFKELTDFLENKKELQSPFFVLKDEQ